MILLDTTFLIQIIRNKDEALAILEKLGTNILATTVINRFEIMLGFYKNKAFINNPTYKIKIKKRIDAIFQKLIFLDFRSEEANIAAELLSSLIKEGKEIGDKDALIAAIMKSNNCKYIITTNVDHFKRIKGIVPIPINKNSEEITFLAESGT